MADHRVKVFINPMRLFEWDEEPIQGLPHDPGIGRLVEYLCPPDVASDLDTVKARYREVSNHDQDLVFSLHESELTSNLFWPLRSAKANFMIGSYVGCIALCGLVAEKLAILVHAVNTTDEAALQEFERKDQPRRVKELKQRALIADEAVNDFGAIRDARKRYLHFWNTNAERLVNDAKRSYAAAVRLVLAVMDLRLSDGAITLNPRLAEFLKVRGAMVEQQGDTNNG
jgi:hypothetical protein